MATKDIKLTDQDRALLILACAFGINMRSMEEVEEFAFFYGAGAEDALRNLASAGLIMRPPRTAPWLTNDGKSRVEALMRLLQT